MGCIAEEVGIQDDHIAEVDRRKAAVLVVGCMNTAGLGYYTDGFVGMEEHTELAHLAMGMSEVEWLDQRIADKGLVWGSSPYDYYQKVS